MSRHFAVTTTLETPSQVKDISAIHVLLEDSGSRSAVLGILVEDVANIVQNH